jgi:beta-1,4-mannosyl-glycoprotein beta-1,4-N-acetylglucosaminyltransferase
MKIYDCFMYFDEDIVLDVRLNFLDKFVDQFVIIESEYNHRG